jgi:uncharacterized membrane protein (DUF2068 family)
MRERPIGISILAALYILMGVGSVIWSLLILGFGGLAWLTGSLFGAQGLVAIGGSTSWSAAFGIALAALQLAVGFGMLAMKRWSWWVAILAAGLTLVEGVLLLLSGGVGAVLCGGVGLLIPLGIVIYLLMPGPRRAFGMR